MAATDRNKIVAITPAVENVANGFDRWARRQTERANYSDQRQLFHYTSLAAIEAIALEEEFRLTGLSQLRKGDRLEIEYGIGLAREALANHPAVNDVQRAMLGTALRTFRWEYFGSAFDCYIGSFTSDPEAPDMWNSDFGRKGAGVALGIAPAYFQSSPGTDGPPEENFIVQPVIYGPEDARDHIRKALEAAARSADEAAPLVRGQEDLAFIAHRLSLGLLASFLVPLCLVTKEERYRREREIRVFSINSRRPGQTGKRPEYRKVAFPRSNIAMTFYGPKCDVEKLKGIWGRSGLDLSLLGPARFV